MIQKNNMQEMEIEIAHDPDGSSLYVDICLPTALARATIGQVGTGRGYCDTEILDTVTEETTYWNHQEFSSFTDLALELTTFFGKLPRPDTSVSLYALLEPLLISAGREFY